MNKRAVKVFAPGSIGNIGPGFDVLGVAVEGVGDVVEACKIKSGIVISEITGDGGRLPLDPDENTAGIAAKEVLNLLGTPGGADLKIHKDIPSGAGLGSSAASAVAGAYAVNLLYGNKLSKMELIMPATLAEAQVSGGFFADNTAPSMLGGATITRSSDPLEIIPLGSIEDLLFCIVTPELEVLTRNARAILPEKIYMKDFISNMANACLITAAFIKNDPELLRGSIDDRVAEPVRAGLIPGFYDVKLAAVQNGAMGCSISGAGPSVFAIVKDEKTGKKAGKAMVMAFSKAGLKSTFRLSGVCKDGAHEID
ncbi:MAG: homoserine kinase [Chloroflexi bacterium]|nr:homoserine kinase [Chloroflexota bacterium]